jgi:D-arabinose 1-dehydrogenase-like Zn-dependent alcohol dehydrogenase
VGFRAYCCHRRTKARRHGYVLAAVRNAKRESTVLLLIACNVGGDLEQIGKTVAETFKGLRPGGVSIVLGVGPEPIEVSGIDLVFGGRKLEGALTGNPATGDETLCFSVLSGVSAMIETVPLEQAADAYAKMMGGKARFRMVLTMGCPPVG